MGFVGGSPFLVKHKKQAEQDRDKQGRAGTSRAGQGQAGQASMDKEGKQGQGGTRRTQNLTFCWIKN